MTSLTDRYVAATLRSIPSRQREELERELRASIADAMEDQTESEALSALGDPSRLAASYTDRPLHLIGPEIFLDYRRMLAVLLSTIVPLIVVAVGITAFQNGADLAEALGASANASLIVAMHIAIWTTVVFALIERTPSMRRGRRGRWDPTKLPDLPANRIDVAAIIGGSIMSGVIAAFLIVMQLASPVVDPEGNPIGLIEPGLWNSGALLLIVVFAGASIAFDVIGYYVGWGVPQALANAILSVLFIATVVGVSRVGELLNPAFFDAVGWQEGAGPNGVVTWIIIAVVVLLSITNAADGFARARKSQARA